MFGLRINITKWLRREITATELALLREEDALAESQMRVRAYRERLRRLNARANARVEATKPRPVLEPLRELRTTTARSSFGDMKP